MYDYDHLLHQLGYLRKQGVPEEDPRIKQARRQLRDALELRKGMRKSKGPLPTLTQMEVVRVKKDLGGIDSTKLKGFALAGAAAGIAYVIYRLVTHPRTDGPGYSGS